MAESLTSFCEKVAILCAATNGSVTSWIRSKKHNKDVGGVDNSLHQIALAVDTIHDTLEDKARAIKLGRRIDLLVIDEGDHLHIQSH
jgi:hypothetical protein